MKPAAFALTFRRVRRGVAGLSVLLTHRVVGGSDSRRADLLHLRGDRESACGRHGVQPAINAGGQVAFVGGGKVQRRGFSRGQLYDSASGTGQ